MKVKSRILNTGVDTQPNINTPIWNKTNLESELRTIIGDAKGLFKREDSVFVAAIPNAQHELEAIEQDFKRYARSRVLEGREKPTEYPKEILTKKLKAEARLDVRLAEKAWLEKKLSEIEDTEDVIEQLDMLKYGLVGSGCFHGLGTEAYNPARCRAELDGQLLHLTPDNEELNQDGFVIILDPRSPYNGLRTSDYYKLCKIWKLERVRKEQERFKKLKEQCQREGKEVPTRALFKSASIVATKDLPPYPEWAKKYDQNGQEIGATEKMKRTK
jgi:hypothetical protein